MTASNYTTHFPVDVNHMNEFITPRKRKSEARNDETSTKKINPQSEKIESKSKKIIRKFSTRFFTPSKSLKSKYQMEENIFNEDSENKVIHVNEDADERDGNICSSMTFFGVPYIKKNGIVNDRVSNSSDTSRQSSSSMVQQWKIGVDLFNRDQKCGVAYLKSKDLVDNDRDLADLFIKKKGISKMRLFEFLTAKENRTVHKCFCDQLNLKFKTIPEVLREYLKYSFITGEYSTMLEIVDVLSHAYIGQHSEGAVMGLNVSQVITIIQYLITFNANEQKEKSSNKISRECFIEYLQTSLTEENKISRQLASCLYLEMCEAPLITTMDERYQNLDKIRKSLTDFPKDFSLMQYHRYIICHVDLSKVVLPSNNAEKPTFHDRTVFLFNDILIISKKNWLYDSNSYKVKQILNLSQIKCALVTRSASYSNPSVNNIRIVQIINAHSTDILLNFHSKLFEDLMSFYTSLDHSIEVHKILIEFYRDYEASGR